MVIYYRYTHTHTRSDDNNRFHLNWHWSYLNVYQCGSVCSHSLYYNIQIPNKVRSIKTPWIWLFDLLYFMSAWERIHIIIRWHDTWHFWTCAHRLFLSFFLFNLQYHSRPRIRNDGLMIQSKSWVAWLFDRYVHDTTKSTPKLIIFNSMKWSPICRIATKLEELLSFVNTWISLCIDGMYRWMQSI